MVEVQRVNKKRWQFILLLFLLIPLGVGLLYLLPRSQEQTTDETSQFHEDSGHAQQTSHAGYSKNFNGIPLRKLPPGFEAQGTVDDRYTMAVDPNTGQTIINDALGGVGTNNTSVDGDRAQLAKDMISLEQYALQNRGTLKPDDYSWLKKMARLGMQLAFGAPGLPSDAQLPIKEGLLSDFHNISSNPTDSLMHTGVFITAENAAQAAETIYQQMADSSGSVSALAGIKSAFLAPDPLSPITAGTTWVDPSLLSNYLPPSLTLDAMPVFVSSSPASSIASTNSTVPAATVSSPSADTIPTLDPELVAVMNAAQTPAATSTNSAASTPATFAATGTAMSSMISTTDTASPAAMTTTANPMTTAMPASSPTTLTSTEMAPSASTPTATTTSPPPAAPTSVKDYYSSILGPTK